jgi:hypothetical protein
MERGVNRRATCSAFRILIISQGQLGTTPVKRHRGEPGRTRDTGQTRDTRTAEPRRYRDNICVTTHGVWCIEWCLDADTAGGRDPQPRFAEFRMESTDVRSNLAMLVLRKPIGKRSPASLPAANAPSTHMQRPSSCNPSGCRSTGREVSRIDDRHHTPSHPSAQKNGDIDVDN